MSPTFYISYSWSPESKQVADAIDMDWAEAGLTLIRDERDIPFKGSLRDFMSSMAGGDYVLMIINEAYFKSKNCMFEALELFTNPSFRDKILPIVLDSAGISSALKRVEYARYWEQEIAKLDEQLRSMNSAANLADIQAELTHYTRIRQSIDGLTGVLKDMLMVRWPTIRSEKYKPIFDYIGYTPPVKPTGLFSAPSSYTEIPASPTSSENYNSLPKSEREEIALKAAFLYRDTRSIIDRMNTNLNKEEISTLNAGVVDIIARVQNQGFMVTSTLHATFELARTMARRGLDADLGDQLEAAGQKIERFF